MEPIGPITLDEVWTARDNIRGAAVRTPLVPLEVEGVKARILLKLENVQPVGSFKIRGASNAMAMIPRELRAEGVYTASAGNMAQGVAWNARRLGIPCSVVHPDDAPDTKVQAIERLGATSVPVPWDVWWEAMENHHHPGIPGTFIHPVANRHVIAGNGTAGLEILEDCPDVDSVIVPFGGGGQSCGIATVFSAMKPDTQVYAAEVETAAPLAASFEADEPVSIDRQPSFVDGIGGASVLEEMWPLVSSLIAGSIVVDIESVVEAIRLMMVRSHIVAEGAGGAALAAALDGWAGEGTIVAVISGGNLSTQALQTIVAGGIPERP